LALFLVHLSSHFKFARKKMPQGYMLTHMGNFASFRLFKKLIFAAAAATLLVAIIDLLWFCIKFPAGLKICPPELLGEAGRPALVLGAGVKSNGEPTQVLEGRLRTALRLFDEKKATWILVSGDNRTQYYNEPQAMRRWLVRHGVPPEKIVSDYAGRRTYDSLKRAQIIFGLGSVFVVTSEFHVARALYLAKNMGIDAIGVPSETKSIGAAANAHFWLREYFARHKAVWDVWFPPSPRLGPRENTPDDLL
jgi:vancomycin permeability regulator SanA